MFLNSKADIVVFGGGAGSGKSYLGAMDMLKYIHDPLFRGVVVRKLTPQIHGPGGIFETFISLHEKIVGKGKIKIKRKAGVLEYPSGATITFRHCQHEDDKYSFQGWQISSALVDEAQQLSGEILTYIMSRLRTDADMRPNMRMTCNPDKNCALREYVNWYLIEGTGLPDPDKCGVLRYFTMQDSVLIWGDTPEEVQEKVPGSKPLSFTFISAVVYDNPVLMERQPDYVAWLEGLKRTEKARLLYGDWDAVEEASSYWKSEWCDKVAYPDGRAVKRVRSWDIAVALPSDVYPNPDWTAGVLMSKNKEKYYTVEHVNRFRDRFAGVEQRIIEQAKLDGPNVVITLPLDPGAQAQSYARSFQAKLAEMGYTVKLIKPKTDKVHRFGAFASISESGFVRVVESDWTDAYVSELESFTGEKKNKDDQVDATSDAFNYLRTSMDLPNFSIPDMTRQNKFTNPFN